MGGESGVSVVRECVRVVVSPSYGYARLPLGSLVRGGGVVGGYFFVTAVPSPCRLSLRTRVLYSACRYSVEAGVSNYFVRVECGRRRELLVYNKDFWNLIVKNIIEPILAGRPAGRAGFILKGAPGSGKSRFVELLAEIYGFEMFIIDTTILNKYVGESEKRLANIIERARAKQPSLILFDDGEWLFSRRIPDDNTGAIATVNNLKQILFSAIQESYRRGDAVIYAVTTNMDESVFDPAFLRPERLGKPIEMPLPDYEAAKAIITDVLGDASGDLIEELAREAVANRMNIVQIREYARSRRKESVIPRRGRGYRIVRAGAPAFNSVEAFVDVPVCGLRRAWIGLDWSIGVAVAAALFGACGTRVIVVDNIIKFVNGLDMEEIPEDTIIILPSGVGKHIEFYLDSRLENYTLVFVGEEKPSIAAYPVIRGYGDVGRDGLLFMLGAVSSYYGLSVSSEELAVTAEVYERAGEEKIRELLVRLISTRSGSASASTA